QRGEETLIRRQAQQVNLHGPALEAWRQIHPSGIVGVGAGALVDEHVSDRHIDVAELPLRRSASCRIADVQVYRCRHGNGGRCSAAATGLKQSYAERTQNDEGETNDATHTRAPSDVTFCVILPLSWRVEDVRAKSALDESAGLDEGSWGDRGE